MTQADASQEWTGRQGPEPSSADRLSLLYQGLLIAIVRISTGKQPLGDAAAYQKRTEGLLDEIQRQAIRVGYTDRDIQDAHYAVVAFLDETVQRSSDPNRNQWSPLQAKRYGEAVAGEGVFERLKVIRTRRDSREVADLLEIYDLCFLLGYQGRYAVGDRAGLDLLIDDLREQIERIRGPQPPLSPDGKLPAIRQAPARTKPTASGNWKSIAFICLATAIAGWVVLWLILNFHTQGALGEITP